MIRLFDEPGETFLKALVWGPSGSGKTRMGCTAPRPLVLLSERQGLRTILDARAEGLAVADVLFMERLADYRAVLRACHGPKDQPFQVFERVMGADGERESRLLLELDPWPKTIVLDSLTDACNLVQADVLEDAPPKPGDDGLPVISLRHWGELGTRCKALIRAFRDVPLHVLFLALEDDRVVETSDGTTTRWQGPKLPIRSLPADAMSAVNVAAYLSRRVMPRAEGASADTDREIVWIARTNGPSYLSVKPYRPLRDVEVPDFADWIARLPASQAAPEAPPEAPEAAPEPEAPAEGAPADKAPPRRRKGGRKADAEASVDQAKAAQAAGAEA
jgi:hypothetical protein